MIELKVGEDIHLPLQGLDYWMRVKWHLDREEIASKGYFPGIRLVNSSPRLLLVSPLRRSISIPLPKSSFAISHLTFQWKESA